MWKKGRSFFVVGGPLPFSASSGGDLNPALIFVVG